MLALSGDIPATSAGKILASQVGGTALNPQVTSFLNSRDASNTTTNPKAYLNIVLLDEQLNPIITTDGKNSFFKQVSTNNSQETLSVTDREITKNGYVYIYVSNETPNVDVFFDNLQVTQTRSPLLEETHYYPFGLTMAGISSQAAGKLENKRNKFQGQEFAHKEFSDGSGLEMYEFKYRMDDPQTGRFWQIDPLADKYVYNSTYAFSENKVTGHVELEGLEAQAINTIINWLAPKIAKNPNGAVAHTTGAVVGITNSLVKTVKGIGNAIAHPINTIMGLAKLTTLKGQMDAVAGLGQKVNEFKKASGPDKTAMVAEATTDLLTAIVGTKGIGAATKGTGAAGIAAEISNPIPSEVARVIPNFAGDVTTLGRPGAADVFVTASSDIGGMNANQIAQRLTIPESSTGFKVITFETPEGIATPYNRLDPGFVNGGKTAGGAREFVIPNQSIPANANIKIVK